MSEILLQCTNTTLYYNAYHAVTKPFSIHFQNEINRIETFKNEQKIEQQQIKELFMRSREDVVEK